MDPVTTIENFIVAGSEGFFDVQEIREDLHVTIRIAHDFYNFLQEFGDGPPAHEIAYVSDTIRSGMDCFFGLAYICRIITGSKNWEFDSQTAYDFPTLRQDFIRAFEDLREHSELKAVDGLVAVLRLTHLELVFLAQNFPVAILGYESEPHDPQSQAELISDVTAHKAGHLSVDNLIARWMAREDARRKAP